MLLKIDLISGFLGSGKTTLIRHLLAGVPPEEKVALIENEFGQVSVDSILLQNAAVRMTEINAGCICCSVKGDFREALHHLVGQEDLDRIIIEPSGVAKLKEVQQAVTDFLADHPGTLNIQATVVDALNYKLYRKNFGDFFLEQIQQAQALIVSKSQWTEQNDLNELEADLRQQNRLAQVVTSDWNALSPENLLAMLENPHPNLEHRGSGHCECPGCHASVNVSGTASSFSHWTKVFSHHVPRERIQTFIESLQSPSQPFGEIDRVKGVCHTPEGDSVGMHYVPGQPELVDMDLSSEESRINVIGRELNKEALEAFWATANKES